MAYKRGLSIVICCHNSAARLRETLAHLARQQVPQEIEWEVVLVNNASTDNTSDTALRLWPKDSPVPLRVVDEPLIGLSYARHKGFLEVRYEFIGFIDDDNWVSPGWIEKAFEIMSTHPDIGACGGLNEAVCEMEPPDWFKDFSRNYAIGPQGRRSGYLSEERGFLWGAGLVVRRSAYQRLVDSGFYYSLSGRKGKKTSSGEDQELTLALRLAGDRLWYEPGLRLKHFLPSERLCWRRLRRMHRSFGASSAAFDPYLYLLNPGKKSFSRLWTKASLEMIEMIGVRDLSLLKLLFFPCEGNIQALGLENELGRLLKILRMNRRYNRSFNTARRLKDRLDNFLIRKASCPDQGSKTFKLITTLYNEQDEERIGEYSTCIRRNLAHPLIDEIHVLYDRSKDNGKEQILRFLQDNNIHISYIDSRPTYGYCFEYANKNFPESRIILSNADIFFNETLGLLNGVDLKGGFLALSRWNLIEKEGRVISKQLEMYKLITRCKVCGHERWLYRKEDIEDCNYNPPCWKTHRCDAGPKDLEILSGEIADRKGYSQDSWIFQTPLAVTFRCDFKLGRNHCDSFLNHGLLNSRFKVYNPCYDIQCCHLHSEGISDRACYRDRKEIERIAKERRKGAKEAGIPWSTLDHRETALRKT